MTPCVYQLVCAVCVLMSGLPQTSADFSTERGKVSKACSKTLDTCVNMAVNLGGRPTPSSNAGWCTLFGATVNGVSAYQCVVRIGLCTDEEFVALKNGACGQTATAQQTSSALKTSVYNVVNSTSSECQARLVDCIFRSSVATVLKQQEQYCKLMNLGITGKTTTTCLFLACTNTEINNLKTTACSTTQSQPFPDAIVATSQVCQNGMELCTAGSNEAFALIQGEKYCDVMSLSVKTTAHDCLLTAGCTETEFQNVKAAACSSGSNIVDFNTERWRVSKACSKTLDTCVGLSGSSNPSTDAVWCNMFDSTVNGVSAYQCVVRIGLCTDEEFVALKNAACGQTATAQQTSSALKTSVNNVVKSTSSACQDQIVDCIFGSSIATVLKQQEQYCKLMNLGITGTTKTTCLTSACTNTEINNLTTTACSTTQSQPFSDAIVATSQKCQNGMELCTYGIKEALVLIRAEKYCDVMSLTVKATAHDCLIAKGCTETEFQKVKAACSGSHIVASFIMLALATLYHIFFSLNV